MGKRKHLSRAIYIWISLGVTAVVFLGSTYAWFTQNNAVNTTEVSAYTLAENFELMLAVSEDGYYTVDSTPITQVNQQNKMNLLPVSTEDMENFLFRVKGGTASEYETCVNEEYIFHGMFYIKAMGENNVGDIDIYFDEKMLENPFGNTHDSVRIGLVMGDDVKYIYHLEDEEDNDPKVVVFEENAYVEKDDPSIPLSSMMIKTEGDNIILPDEKITTLEIGRPYRVDVYLYIEGNDEDCNERVAFSKLDFIMAFYGNIKE